jgi:hypothetical protein
MDGVANEKAKSYLSANSSFRVELLEEDVNGLNVQ